MANVAVIDGLTGRTSREPPLRITNMATITTTKTPVFVAGARGRGKSFLLLRDSAPVALILSVYRTVSRTTTREIPNAKAMKVEMATINGSTIN
jgi:hypothetical protein